MNTTTGRRCGIPRTSAERLASDSTHVCIGNGMEGNGRGREERVETSIHFVAYVPASHATAWMGRNR